MELYQFVFQCIVVDEDNIHSDASMSSLMSAGKINLSRKKTLKKAQSYEKLNFVTEKRVVDGNGN